jgi:mRNA interferase MazF
MRRGSVHWIDLEPVRPGEMGKQRPCVIVSNSSQNLLLPTVVVVPLSSQPGEIWPLRLAVPVGKRKSFAVIPALRAVHRTRLGDSLGILDAATQRRLHDAIALYLSE